jgi:hypothetical protein
MVGETALAHMDLEASRADVLALSAFTGGPQEGFPHFPNEVLQRIGKEGCLAVAYRYQAATATDVKKLEEASPYLDLRGLHLHR